MRFYELLTLKWSANGCLIVVVVAGWLFITPGERAARHTPGTLAWLTSASVAYADQASDDYAAAVGFYKGSRWSLAVDAFKKFLTANPKHDRAPFARLYLGLSLANLDKYDEARTVLRAFVKEFPNNQHVPQAMYRVAEASYFLDDLKSAEPEFLAFLTKSPDDPLREFALPYLGDTQLRLGKADVATQNFQKALKDHPQSKMAEDARFGLAKSFEAQQKFPEAMDLYRQLAANKAGVRAAQSQWQLAARLFENKDFANAAKAYTDLDKNFPESRYVPAARLNAGYAHFELKDFKAAAVQFELAAKDAEQAATASYWRGLSQKQQGDLAGAAATMKTAFETHQTQPIAEQMLFQLADCELRQNQFEQAEQHFVDVAKRWPQGQWADDALYFSGEAALQRANRAASPEARLAALQSAEATTKQFLATQPNSGLKLFVELLRGRVLLARGGDADAAAAATLFQNVLAAAQRPQTQMQARYHLARAQQRLKQHAAAVQSLAPVVEQVRKDGATSEFVDALVLQATSMLAEKKYAESTAAAAEYIKLAPKGEQLDQATATKVLADGNLGQFALAKEWFARLRQASPNSPLIVPTSHQLAEAAYSQKQYDAALEWFTTVVNAVPQSPHFVVALSGQSWCQFEKKQYKPAAAGYARLVKDFPQHELAAESAFKLGESLQFDGQLPEAAKAFADAFDGFSPGRYGYLSGLQAARVLGQLKKVEEADAAYAKLLQKFPKPESLDKLFDEWALLNYESERFGRADEIFKRLIAETPNSELADNARFSLAESELFGGKLDGAKTAFRQLEQDPKSDADVQQDSLFRLMAIAEEQQQWEELGKTSEAIRTRFAEGRYKSDAAFYLALSQLQRGQVEPALELLKPLAAAKADRQVAAKDWFPRVFVLVAETYQQQKKYNEVVATVTEFRAWDAKNKFLYQADEVLGRVYKQQTKFDEARTVFKLVIDSPHGAKTETAAKAQFMIAETYFIQKDYKLALENYLKVHILYKFPDWQAPALFQAAACDEQLGDWSQAVKDYETLVKDFSKSEFAEKAKPRLEAARKNVK